MSCYCHLPLHFTIIAVVLWDRLPPFALSLLMLCHDKQYYLRMLVYEMEEEAALLSVASLVAPTIRHQLYFVIFFLLFLIFSSTFVAASTSFLLYTFYY
ncbi:Uncharacterized protein TCM_015589 [Theobroma cacao]|uniref:Uncharacterized protein n=1 Tax=Theobroma cacao TaxID=3641 RepID=A0A061G343_THECC|nr:Uncharacterized protein TCM_015589 [Theobroma cacao]